MTLVNFTKKHRRRNGGIRLLGLIDQREVVSATYSELDKGFTELTLDEGASLSKFEFLEDGAEYRETIAAKDGAPTVAHELTFTLERMDADTAAAIEAIIEASRSGLIAVVVTINGDALLLGYSQEFGKERPLRIASAQATTGRLLSETTSETVTLRSEDVSKAPAAAGRPEQPVLENLTVFRPNATTGRRNRRGGLFRTVSSASRPDTEGGRLTARPPS